MSIAPLQHSELRLALGLFEHNIVKSLPYWH